MTPFIYLVLRCGNVNFARRFNCNRCGVEKKIDKVKRQGIEIGSAAAEKSKGLFAADDWQCNKCGNVNWARRSTCNMCNAPKFTEVEERTGLGGGFNERGVVEYKERQESDDEYDDFGRIKKKKGETRKVETKQEHVQPVVEDEDEDEEEEDEEDDGDLSKYDLWGNDDDNAKSKDDKSNGNADKKVDIVEKKEVAKPRSRSRSRSKKKSRRSRRFAPSQTIKVYLKLFSSSSSSSSSRSRSRDRRKRSRSRKKSRRSRSRSGRRRRHSSSSRSRSRSR